MKLTVLLLFVAFNLSAQVRMLDGRECTTQAASLSGQGEVEKLSSYFLRTKFIQPEDLIKNKNGDWHLFSERNVSEAYLKTTLSKIIINTEKMDVNYIPSCPHYVEGKTYLFGFEGYKAYNPIKAEFYKKIQLTSVDTELFHFYCQNKDYKKFITKECEILKNKIENFSLFSSLVNNIGGYSLRPFLLDYVMAPYMAQKEFQNIEWSYYRQDGGEEALRCIEKLYEKNPNVEIKLVGHSYGGYAAMELATKLEELNIPVKSVLSIDPVPRLLNINLELKKSSNVDNYYNVYQRQDDSSIFEKNFGIRGLKVENADEEELVTDMRISHAQRLIYMFHNIVTSELNKEEDEKEVKKTVKKSSDGDLKKEIPPNNDHTKIVKSHITHKYFLKLLRD
mgnify:FL=1